MNTKQNKVCNITISNPDKILFSKTKTTKLELIKYYEKVAPYMLKFLNNRLITELRCHNKNKQVCFYKKHPEKNENVQTFYINKSKTSENCYFFLKNKTQLINQVQLGTVEFHIWGSKIDKLNYPDIMVFDFDPDEKLSLDNLKQQVKNLKQVLDQLNLKSFLKTSGGKGYHVCVPFQSSVSWKKFSQFAQKVASLMEQKWADKITTTMSKKERRGKIFVDYLRNKKGATCVCPYSVRAKDTPFVSMPISWEQLDKIAPNFFTINNVTSQVLQQNAWKNFFKVQQKLS